MGRKKKETDTKPLLLLLIPSLCTTHTIAHVPPLHISDTRYVSDFPSSFIRHTLFIRSPTTIYQTHAPFHELHSYHYLHAFVARPHAPLFTCWFWDHPYSRLINAKATTNDGDPTIYIISITVSMGIEPTAPLFTRFQRAPPNSAICTLFYDDSHTAHTT